MFKQVIVGIDGARSDHEAVAAARAVAPEAKLDLVSVYPDTSETIADGMESYREMLRGDALRQLQACQQESGAADAELHPVPNYAPARGLKAHARETGADLIVLGAASHSPLGRVVLGDVARGVLHGAPCPVLAVARSRSAAAVRPRVIGVAYDSSPEAGAALEVAVDLAKSLSAHLEIVEAVDIGVTPAIWGFQVADYLEGLVGPEQQRMHDLALDLPVPATGTAVQGSVYQVLHNLSTRVDLMACGSRSWGAPGRIAFGSTADRLVHHSPVPVLVVPRGSTAPSDGVEATEQPTGAAA